MDNIIEVKNLKTKFKTEDGEFFAVDDISFHLKKGQTLGIVGESGCGKSVTSLSMMRLIQNPGKIESGEILYRQSDLLYQQRDLLKLSESEMQKIRGAEIAMIFQEPMTSLNPVFTIGFQIDETIQTHEPQLTQTEIKNRSVELLKKVGISSPESRYFEYPHQLSGGMRQRVMIAMAMACNPQVLIADEPTTALDVTIQAQILDLIRKLQKDNQTAVILITHDLGVVAEMCDEVAVMYAGQMIEYGTVDDIFYRPAHPYTKGLLDSIPHFESGTKLDRLKTIPGMVPSLMDLPQGCRFNDRCTYAQDKCLLQKPNLEPMTSHFSTHRAACFFPLMIDRRKGDGL
ncbi:MAG: ABC transporter ATP-binding protein [Pseudobdellovibrionaceae bacterium]